MASGSLRAADWLGELNASSWLGELPPEEPKKYRIPPRPSVSRYHREEEDTIPPEPEFEDEAPPVPDCPPPRVGAGWYEMVRGERKAPPLRLAPPFAPAALKTGMASSKSQPDLAFRDPALQAWLLARRRDVITIVKPSINTASTISTSSKSQLDFAVPDLTLPDPTLQAWPVAHRRDAITIVKPSINTANTASVPSKSELDLAVQDPTLRAWPLARSRDAITIAKPSINTASATSNIAKNNVNAAIDENGAANGDMDKEVFRCTGQCGKQWSSWEEVPHWSKSSRPRKPWCKDCGNDKLGPWNEWGSTWQ